MGKVVGKCILFTCPYLVKLKIFIPCALTILFMGFYLGQILTHAFKETVYCKTISNNTPLETAQWLSGG